MVMNGDNIIIVIINGDEWEYGTGVAFAPTSCGVALAPVGANVTRPRFAWQAQ